MQLKRGPIAPDPAPASSCGGFVLRGADGHRAVEFGDWDERAQPPAEGRLMLPVVLDLAQLRVALVGNGEAARRRLERLDAAAPGELRVYADDPSPGLARAAGARLRRHRPTLDSLADIDVLFIADLPDDAARTLATVARARRILVNVEDRPELSQFHSPSVLRRGDLVVAVSSGGRSPGLARKLRHYLEPLIGAEWQARLDQVAARRQAWREAGADAVEIGRWTDQWIDREGWLAAASTDDRGGVHVASSR
jgi:precorrin-2 dehydrogenase/sirohydrochlorin ferrochelatase